MTSRFDFETLFASPLVGYGMTTANILYFLPDHPSLIQNFIWQFYDHAPKYPRLVLFVNFWDREIETEIHKIEISHKIFVN